MTSLRFYFLGPLDIRSGDQQLPKPPTSKSQSLLAYLALHHSRPQPRDRLIGLFWGDRSERKARHSLSTALWHIRRCLPDESILVSDAGAVHLERRAGFWLDVEEFEAQARSVNLARLQSALALYRGDLLEGFYDDWILGERYRLEAIFVETLARLMALHEARGNPRAALATAQRLLDRDPLREDAHRAAMRTHCRLGQRNAALEQYARCRDLIQAELGAEPVRETAALHRAILAGDFQVAPAPRVLSVAVPPASRAGRSPLDVISPVRLVGRERELGLLEDTWRVTGSGCGRLVLISGEVGVGKTRLVEEFAGKVHWQGAHVLCGRCYEFERALPYQPFAEALRAPVLDMPGEQLAAFPPWAIAEVGRLVPELRDRRAASKAAAGGNTGLHAEMAGIELDEGQSYLFRGATHILAALSSRAPLLLLLEDLHWAGESTLALLHHLVQHLAQHHVLFVGTFRPEAIDARHPLRGLGRRLAREGLAHALRLSRLSRKDVETMIVEMSGAGQAVAPLAARLYRETEGNPFFLIEILKALFEVGAVRLEGRAWQGDFARISAGALPLPAGVSEAIQARARRLEESAQEALGVAAVLGGEFDFDLLNAAWGKGEEATLEALDSLLRQKLVEEAVVAGDSDFTFTHHKIQEVVYESLPRRRRVYLHAQVGIAMENLHAADLQARAGELAHHFERACVCDTSLSAKAVAYLLAAGHQAVRQSANKEAMAYYRRGLDLLQTLPETAERTQQEIELQLALAGPTAVVYGYPAPETRCVYDRVHDLCRHLDHTPAHFDALVGLCRYYGVGGDLETALALAHQLFAIARDAEDGTLLIEACRQLAGSLFALGRLEEGRGLCERGLTVYDTAQHERLAYRFGHDPAAALVNYLGMTLWLLGYADQSGARSRKLGDLALSMTHPSSIAYAHCFVAAHACMRRDVPGTQNHAEVAIELGERHGLPSWRAMATALNGWALTEQGRHMGGLDRLQDGIIAFRARGFVHMAPFLLGLQTEACVKIHRLAEAAAALSEASAIVHSGADRFWLPELQRLQGELARAQGRGNREAELHFRQAIDTVRSQGARMLELRATMSLAQLWRDQGRRRDAYEALAEVYHRFDEGFAAQDLQAAVAVLETLA